MASHVHLEAEDLSRLLAAVAGDGVSAEAKKGALGVFSAGSVCVTVKTFTFAGTVRVGEDLGIEVHEVQVKDGDLDVSASIA